MSDLDLYSDQAHIHYALVCLGQASGTLAHVAIGGHADPYSLAQTAVLVMNIRRLLEAAMAGDSEARNELLYLSPYPVRP